MVTVTLGPSRSVDLLAADFPTVGDLAAAAAVDAELDAEEHYSLRVNGTVAGPRRQSALLGSDDVLELVVITGYETMLPVDLDPVVIE